MRLRVPNTVPDGVTRIGKGAFEDCSALNNIDIPESVAAIEDEAFSACFGLTGIAFQGDAPAFGNTYSVTMDKNRADRQVYCVITDRYGESVTTDTVTLKMLTPVTIIQQPVSVTVPEGKLAVVRTRAVGEGLSYKWYFKNAGDSRFYQTASFTGDTYSVTMDDSRAGRQVYCAVTDAEGNTVATEIVTLNKK